MSSADVAPVLDFVDAHIIRVEGIEDREGNPVDEWQPLEAGDRREVLRMMPPHELANLYAAIKQSASLSVDRKND